MTDREINVAIAGLCGWQDVSICDDGSVVGLPPGFTEDMCPEGADEVVPNYCGDLNAIQRAVIALPNRTLKGEFQRKLNRIARNGNWLVCELPPQAWCEAFLRVHGKWRG